jgi:ABC-type sugar transport system substrate-binding protein
MSRCALSIALALVLAAVLSVGAAACGDDEEEGGGGTGGEAAGEQFKVGVSLASPTIPLYVGMAEGMRAKAKELGMELSFTDANEDPVQQLNDIQDLLAQNLDGLLVSPIDAEAAVPAYEDAQAADVTVMSIARNTDPKVEDSFIGAPWGKYGEQIAEWTCEETGGKGEIAMIKGPAGASFVEDMSKAYKDYMESECPGMKVVFEVNAAPLTKDQGLQAAQDALSGHRNVRAIFANNDDLAAGAVQALEERGLDDVTVTGFDGTPGGVDLVRGGQLGMTIALRPFQWGALGVETMQKALRGEKVPKLVEIETMLIDEENIGDITPEDVK